MPSYGDDATDHRLLLRRDTSSFRTKSRHDWRRAQRGINRKKPSRVERDTTASTDWSLAYLIQLVDY